MLKHIAHFIHTTNMGGAERIVVDMAKEQIRRGHKVTIFMTSPIGEHNWLSCQFDDVADDITLVTLSSTLMKYWQVSRILLFGWKFAKILRLYGIDVLISHMYSPSLRGGFAKIFYSKMTHIAVQHDVFTIKEKSSRVKWLKLVKLFGTKIVNISTEMRDIYFDFNIITRLIFNGAKEPKPEYMQNTVERSTNQFLVVSRLVKLKRIQDTILGLSVWNTKYPEKSPKSLLILGIGPEKKRLVEYSKMLNVDVTFKGFVDDPYPYMLESGCLISTSTAEGMSCSMLEAMSVGLPIIATEVGGSSDLVFDDKTGFLVPFVEGQCVINDVVEAIDRYNRIVNTEYMEHMYINSRKMYINNFTFKVMLDNYEKLY